MNLLTPRFPRNRIAAQVSGALALMCLAHGNAWAQDATPAQAVVVTGKVPETPAATQSAPSQSSLEARTALSIVDDNYIRNYTVPTADYTQIVATTPGAFSYTANGVGLGDTKITMRGLADSYMSYTFDGIPFNDTNGVSHHSWSYFPSQFLGGVVVDRGPGSASSVGQATFGGTVMLQSRVLESEKRTSFTASTGTWNTMVLGMEHDTGDFGADGKSNLLVNMQSMSSDGYQTYNKQDRQTISTKFQTSLGDKTTLTLFGDYLGLTNNTPNIKGVTRTNVDAGNYNILLGSDPTRGDYFGYNFYDLYTSFGYAGISTEVDGWKIDDKLYRYQYHNKQNYANKTGALPTTASISTAATDKLNSYITDGNLLKASREFSLGTLRTGLLLDQAHSRRYQIPANPKTWVDQPLSNFYETYITTTVQPYVEFEFKLSDALKLTPGVKYASYKQDFVHALDNSNFSAANILKATGANGTSLNNSVSYSDVLPTLDLHYLLQKNWSAYVQAAIGDEIPSTSVFDVPGAMVSPPPKPTKAKTVQVGTVWTTDVMSLAADIYHSKLDGAYTQTGPDANGNYAFQYAGAQTNEGIEFEGNFRLGSGFSLYANATFGSYKAADGTWVAGAPDNTQTVSVNYEQGPFAVNLAANRVGTMVNDASGVRFTIDPVTVANLAANYTLKMPASLVKKVKLQLAVNNLLNSHSITGVASAASAGTPAVRTPAGDLLNVLPARSVMLSVTADF